MTGFKFALLLFLGLPFAALAGVTREIGQAELRELVATGNSISLSRVIDVVARQTPGEPVDVRLFDVDGLFYRVVVVQTSGRVVRVAINARTGDILSENSPTAARVRSATTSASSVAAVAGKSKAKNGDAVVGAAKGGGNSGTNDNGNGNGKSNGNDNSSGNSNGNGKN